METILIIVLSLFFMAISYIVMLKYIVIPDLKRKLNNAQMREKVAFEIIADAYKTINELTNSKKDEPLPGQKW